MKKGLILFLAFCCFAAAQDKQKVAVYMAGEESKEIQGMHKIIGAELAKAIGKSGRFSAIDRTNQILAQLGKEHTFQRSGAVDDRQIKALGKQFGIDYLCIAEITTVKGGAYYMDVRLVDVATAENKAIATGHSTDLWNIGEMVGKSQQLAQELIDKKRKDDISPAGQDEPQTPSKENVAVHIIGTEPRTSQGMHKIIGSELAKAISRSGKYSAVDRTAQIAALLNKEMVYQTGGAVDERHIKKLGKQLGAQYICAAEISAVSGGAYYMDVRLVDVVTAENADVVTEHSRTDSWNIDEMVRIAQKIAVELVGAPPEDSIAAQTDDGGPLSPASSPDLDQNDSPPEDSPADSNSVSDFTAARRKIKFGFRLAGSYLYPEELRLNGNGSESKLKIDGMGGTLGFTAAFPLGEGETALVPEINFDVKLIRLSFAADKPGEAVEYFLTVPVLIRFALSRCYFEGGIQAEIPIMSDSDLYRDERMLPKIGFAGGLGLVIGTSERAAGYLGIRAAVNLMKFGGEESFSPSAKFAFGLSLLF